LPVVILTQITFYCGDCTILISKKTDRFSTPNSGLFNKEVSKEIVEYSVPFVERGISAPSRQHSTNHPGVV